MMTTKKRRRSMDYYDRQRCISETDGRPVMFQPVAPELRHLRDVFDHCLVDLLSAAAAIIIDDQCMELVTGGGMGGKCLSPTKFWAAKIQKIVGKFFVETFLSVSG